MAPSLVPPPRTPLDAAGGDPVRQWYETTLGWATAAGPAGAELLTGLRFDVLELPAEAGFPLLRRLDPRAPVALAGETMRLLVAAGGADELPGLLDWLEWGTLPLDLKAVGAGGRVAAPTPPGRSGPPEAAVWVRPPDPGCAVEPLLPAMTALSAGAVPPAGRDALGTSGSFPAAGPDLVRLVDAAATECHRVRLRRACAQPLAFSYASRMDAGTRPRSLTS